ncbi:hypothetical protein [Lysobacter enzymogenes]|uniref:hypothetical protein n=1 Tax=Lysobacter enzymogenes TaxID=69 RepID=UPI00089979D8|nr:hypothetical protein [Lysobacter enzymogenes]SDX39556.1 hypothetical protein SAMN05421681_105104 [Lysobacter enzymogenes]
MSPPATNDELVRQRAFDIDAQRHYWKQNPDLLPDADLFSPCELDSAVSLGIESAVRGRAPAEAQEALRATYYRLVALPMASWSCVLAVISAVHQRAMSFPQVRAQADAGPATGSASAAREALDWLRGASPQLRLRLR